MQQTSMFMPGFFELLILGGIGLVAVAIVIAILVSTNKKDRD